MRWHTIAKYIKETLDKNGLSVWHSQVKNVVQCSFGGNMFDNEERY